MDGLKNVLGVAQKLDCFTDKKKRTAYPVTMRDFPDFIEKFTFINTEKMWSTMIFEEGLNALKSVLTVSFKDDDIDGLMDQVNAGNYKELIDAIMSINGIDFNKAEDEKNVMEV
jgi:hypothetical protein